MKPENKSVRRLTLDIPVELHKKLKLAAAARGTSMKALAEQWIRENVDKPAA